MGGKKLVGGGNFNEVEVFPVLTKRESGPGGKGNAVNDLCDELIIRCTMLRWCVFIWHMFYWLVGKIR